VSSVSSVKQIQHLRGSSSAEGGAACEEVCLSRCWSADGVVEEVGLFRKTVCESSEVVDGLLADCSLDSCEAEVGVG